MPSLVQNNEAESSLAGNAATFLYSSQPNATRNEPGIENENSSGDHSLQKELAVSLPLVPDPAKMVLNNMKKCLAQYLINGDFEESFTCSDISLLNELMSVALPLGSHLKAYASTLATQWKANMGGNTVTPLEGISFLLFVATYGLVCMFSIEEIVQLLGLVSQSKLALELGQIDAFAAKIADIVRDLIEKKQLTEAVKFIFTFKLTDKPPPVSLLKEYVADAMKCFEVICFFRIPLEEKVKVADNLIGDLQAVLQCIEDYNLESGYPSKAIEVLILQLEQQKKVW